VLVDGRITEDGDHADLMARAGTYARMFSLQASGYGGEEMDPADEAVLAS
jgi:hypothetical protein